MNILVTAGSTREPIDPVRYLTNRSSGKMGYALANAGAQLGHRVTLISGPTNLDIPINVDYVPVETAQEMFEATSIHIARADAAIFSAAVADYRPATFAENKIRKSEDHLTIELVRNADILGSARSEFHYEGVLVGFAAETENLEEHAREKLRHKSCDLVVANDVSPERHRLRLRSQRSPPHLPRPDRVPACGDQGAPCPSHLAGRAGITDSEGLTLEDVSLVLSGK